MKPTSYFQKFLGYMYKPPSKKEQERQNERQDTMYDFDAWNWQAQDKEFYE